MATIKASFKLDASELMAILGKLKKQTPKIAARALNKSAKSTKVAMVRAVREDLKLKAVDVRDSIKLEQARPSTDPVAKLRVSAKRIPLIKFGASKLKSRLIKANTGKGRKAYPGAFIATIGGRRAVFKRKGKARTPTEELKGPSIAKAFAANWRVGAKKFREQLPKNLAAELKFAMRRK